MWCYIEDKKTGEEVGMRNKLFLLVLMLVCIGAKAQDTLQWNRNNIKISVMPLLTASPYLSFEHSFSQGLSLEVDAYYHNADFRWNCLKLLDNNELGTQVGMKWVFAIHHARPFTGGLLGYINQSNQRYDAAYFEEINYRNAMRKYLKSEGYMVSGTYLKAGLTYLHKWGTFDCFVGNQGHTIITEPQTVTGNQWGLNLILGDQTVTTAGFIFDIYGGLHLPLSSTGLNHQYRITAAYYEFLTIGIRMGWCF